MRRGECIFREEDHTYWLDGRQLPSVTQLLAKHGISTDLSNAPEDAVRRAGEHGTLVHKEIENFIKTGEMGITDEFQDFLRMVYPLTDTWLSEVLVWTEDYAGTVDLIGILDDGFVVIDTKTGNLNLNSATWQVSMYSNAFPHGQKDVKHYIFDAKMDGESKVILVEPVPQKCIDRLIECERNGVSYNPILPIESRMKQELIALERSISDLQAEVEAKNLRLAEIKAELLRAMEDNHVVKYDGPVLSLTLVEPYVRNTVDTKKLKEQYRDAYIACLKLTQVKASLRMEVKA